MQSVGPHKNSTDPPSAIGSHFQSDGSMRQAAVLMSKKTTRRQIHRLTLCRLKLTSLADGGSCATCLSVMRTMKMLDAHVSASNAARAAIISTRGDRLRAEFMIAYVVPATVAMINRIAPASLNVVLRE